MLRCFKPFRVSNVQRFKDPDTGFEYRAPDRDFKKLLIRIVNYRQQNDLSPIENLEAVVEHYQCSLPMNRHNCEVNKKLSRSLSVYLKGGLALLRNLAYKSFATQEEADRRAEICLQCPANICPDDPDIYMQWSDHVAISSIGDRKSKHHDKLYHCSVCSCPLRCKVFYNGVFEFKEKELKRFPHFCWQKKIHAEQNSNQSTSKETQ